MRAAAIERFGGPEVVSVRTLPVPALDATEVLIAVDTAGVASWDADMRDGWSPSGNSRFPLVLGTDGSGIVAAVGSRVRRFKVGERVYGYSFDNPKGGFYAEYVAVPGTNAAPLPANLDLLHAGAVPAVGLTALQGIDDALRVKRGQTVIVHGASGGVGHLALQFAKLRGARVLATASGEDGVALVRRLGADAVVDGKRADVAAAARSFVPDGVDAVLALVGGDSLERCLDAVRDGGRLAYPNGVEPEPKKRSGVEFVTYDAIAGPREFEKLCRAIEDASLKVHVLATYPLSDAAKAHQRLAEGHILGKIVLRID